MSPRRWLAAAVRATPYDRKQAYRLLRFRVSQRSSAASGVLVYQMGKVGSSTVVASLRNSAPSLCVYHVHYLTEAGLADREAFYRSRYSALRRVPHHLVEGRYIQRLMTADPHLRWPVVTLVRDPVACNVSRFFQTLPAYHPELRVEEWATEGWVDAVVDRFLTEHNHRVTLDWLDKELKPALRLDVYATPFDCKRGYETYTSEVADLLLLRLEDLDRVGGPALAEFLGLRHVALSAANTSAVKPYAQAYNAFRTTLARHTAYFDEMYGSPFARHFYSDTELRRLRRRWTESASSPA